MAPSSPLGLAWRLRLRRFERVRLDRDRRLDRAPRLERVDLLSPETGSPSSSKIRRGAVEASAGARR